MNIDKLKERYIEASKKLSIKQNVLYSLGLTNYYSIMETTEKANDFYTMKAKIEIDIEQLMQEKNDLINSIKNLTSENFYREINK